MSNINNVNNIKNTVVIGHNHIKYYDEILKISNISRTWIFLFQNIEKKQFEKAMQVYEENKALYEASEILKNKKSLRNNLICTVIFVVLLFLSIKAKYDLGVFIFLCLIGVFSILAFVAALKDIDTYPQSPPQEDFFPDKYGLGIEMNSGHIVTFSAIGDEGVEALRKLQNNIEEADVHKNIIYFNLNENNIIVENNDGIINTGDYANNSYQRDELSEEEQGN